MNSQITNKYTTILRYSLVLTALLGVSLSAPTVASAAWNGQLYQPGATLDPECAPLISNCDVMPPASSSHNTNITALDGLTTPITVSQGGTGLAGPIPSGALMYGSGGSVLQWLAIGTPGQVLKIGVGGLPLWSAESIASYQAGNGIALTGNSFSLDTSGTQTWTAAQTMAGGVVIGGTTLTNVAGSGLAVSSGTLKLDTSNLATVSTAGANDRLLIYDPLTGNQKTITSDNLLAATQHLTVASSGSSATTSSNSGLELSGSSLALLRGCGSGQLLKWVSGSWRCDNDDDSQYAAGSGLVLSSGNFALDTAGTQQWTGNQTFLGGLTLNGQAITDLAGTGLAVTNGTLAFDAADLSTAASANPTDRLVLYNPVTGTTATVSTADLLSGVTGSLNYQGTWNASTGTPNLLAICSGAHKGYYYVVATAGTSSLNGTSQWGLGDWVICDGSVWNRLQNSNTIASIFGRTGAITAQAGDYQADQIGSTAGGSLSATTVQAALQELASEKYGVGDSLNVGGIAGNDLHITKAADRHTMIAGLTNSSGSTGFYATDDNPEGDISASVGALAIDSTHGLMYIKSTGSGSSGWSVFGSSSGCDISGCAFTGSSTAVSAATADGSLQILSNGNGALMLDSTGQGAIKIATGSAKTTTIGTASSGSAVIINGGSGLTVSASSVMQSTLSVLGDFTVGSIYAVNATDGSVAVNGNAFQLNGTTGDVHMNGGLTASGASSFGGAVTVGGALVTSAIAISNLPTGGSIGSAGATVDRGSYFVIAQTTAGQTISFPAPTDATAGRLAYVSNTGSATLYLYGSALGAGKSAALAWTGSGWPLANPGSDQICLSNGCTFSTGATIQTQAGGDLALRTDTTGALSLDSGTSGAIALGTGASAKTITFGNTTGSTALVLHSGSAGLSADSTASTSVATTLTANAVTSGTALGVTANALTSGQGMRVTSSSTSLSGDIAFIALTGDNSANTGNLLRLSSTGTTSSATGLRIDIAGTGLAQMIDGAIAWKSLSYAATGTQHNVAFAKSTATVRLNPASNLTIGGIKAGADGQLLTLWNASSNTVTLGNEQSGSLAANRIATGASDLSMSPATTAILQYDASSAVWRVVSRPAWTPSYLMATLAGNQTLSIAVADPVRFSSVVGSTGSAIGLNAGTYSFTLKANRVYELTGQINAANFNVLNVNAYVNAAWYDTTGTPTQIGQSCTVISVTTTLLGSGGSPICSAIFAPSVDTTVQLRINGVSGLLQIGSSGALPTAVIKELSGSQ